jgi:two-component system chemotaxis response regulator CheB
VNILVVDDSIVYRSQIKAALSSAAFIKEIDSANNGKIALDKIKMKKYDLVTLDLEMPEMDGIETLKQIKSMLTNKIRVIMFSSQTQSGSEKTLEALRLGADDFVAKPMGEKLNIDNASDVIRDLLIPKLRQFIAGSSSERNSPEKITNIDNQKTDTNINPNPVSTYTYSKKRPILNYLSKDLNVFNPKIVVIASSTGGPPALDLVFSKIGKQLSCPVLLAQHMPPVFTTSLAKRIQEVSGITCSEAKNMETLENKIYVAPGNFHMSLVLFNNEIRVQLDQRIERNHVRPAADYLFETAAKHFSSSVLGIVLTGMGDDGCDGAMEVKKAGGGLIIQSQETCAVFGMPGAIHDVKAFDAIMSPKDINLYLKRKIVRGGN